MSLQQREIAWYHLDTGELVGGFPLQQDSNDDYICPICGKPAKYSEGQMYQDLQGNDIYGWWFDCYPCKLSSENTEGTGSNDYD